MRIFPALALLALSFGSAQAELPSPPAATPAAATLEAQVRAILAEAPAGSRFGLLVMAEDGTPILALRPDERFIPASNTKMFTTTSAFARQAALDGATMGTGVRLEAAAGRRGAPDVVLVGRGDARLSSATECAEDCLATLADAVAARTKKVHAVIGDDSWFPDERWSPGMSWNNIVTRYGTGISALTLDDNELTATVIPGQPGEPPAVAWATISAEPAARGGAGYYRIVNEARTVPGIGNSLDIARMPNSDAVRLVGTIGAQATPETLHLGIDDPARYAAWRMGTLLRERGVRVSGGIAVRHRPLSEADDPARRGAVPFAAPVGEPMLAELPMPPVAVDVRTINKVSQNLHAELMLRRVGRLAGGGSIADGQAAVQATMAEAGVPRAGFDFSDGSGMSSYNRLSPRAAVTLLRWAAAQPWGAAWRETLPVGGRDGTLRRRFAGTALDGKLFAKTGSLNASRALSGYFVAASGRTLVFSLLANDVPDEQGSAAIARMDKALLAIAAAQ